MQKKACQLELKIKVSVAFKFLVFLPLYHRPLYKPNVIESRLGTILVKFLSKSSSVQQFSKKIFVSIVNRKKVHLDNAVGDC